MKKRTSAYRIRKILKNAPLPLMILKDSGHIMGSVEGVAFAETKKKVLNFARCYGHLYTGEIERCLNESIEKNDGQKDRFLRMKRELEALRELINIAQELAREVLRNRKQT
jgi:hypothetical protein